MNTFELRIEKTESVEDIENFFLENKDKIKGNSYYNIKIAGIGEKALMVVINNNSSNKEFVKYEDLCRYIEGFKRDVYNQAYMPAFYVRIILNEFTDLDINIDDVTNEKRIKEDKELEMFKRIIGSKSVSDLRKLKNIIIEELDEKVDNNSAEFEELDMNKAFRTDLINEQDIEKIRNENKELLDESDAAEKEIYKELAIMALQKNEERVWDEKFKIRGVMVSDMRQLAHEIKDEREDRYTVFRTEKGFCGAFRTDLQRYEIEVLFEK